MSAKPAPHYICGGRTVDLPRWLSLAPLCPSIPTQAFAEALKVLSAGLLVLATSICSFGGLVVTGASGLTTGFLAWWNQAPAYQILLAAIFGMGGALLVSNQCLRLITAWKVPAAISRQQARRLDRTDPKGIRLGGSTAFIITLLASAFIVVSGIAITNWYTTWRRDTDNTYLVAVAGQITINLNNREIPLGITFNHINLGNLPIVGDVYASQFEYPDHDLTSDEEDTIFRGIDARIVEPVDSGRYLYPGKTEYGFWTFTDKRFNNDQYEDFMAGKIRIYLLIEHKYLVSGYVKITEQCVYYHKLDFPSAHGCQGHHRWRWK